MERRGTDLTEKGLWVTTDLGVEGKLLSLYMAQTTPDWVMEKVEAGASPKLFQGFGAGLHTLGILVFCSGRSIPLGKIQPMTELRCAWRMKGVMASVFNG